MEQWNREDPTTKTRMDRPGQNHPVEQLIYFRIGIIHLLPKERKMAPGPVIFLLYFLSACATNLSMPTHNPSNRDSNPLNRNTTSSVESSCAFRTLSVFVLVSPIASSCRTSASSPRALALRSQPQPCQPQRPGNLELSQRPDQFWLAPS